MEPGEVGVRRDHSPRLTNGAADCLRLTVWLDFLSSKAVRLFFSQETIAQFDQLPTPIGIADGDSPSILLISPRNHFHVENLDWHDRTPREVRVDPACTRLSGISSRRKSMAPLSCSLLGVRYGSCLRGRNSQSMNQLLVIAASCCDTCSAGRDLVFLDRARDGGLLEPFAPDIGAVDGQEVEAVQEHAGIMLARMQALYDRR